MYVVSNRDGIPILVRSVLNSADYREATEEEVSIFTQFWALYWDHVGAGETECDALEESIRAEVLTSNGLAHLI